MQFFRFLDKDFNYQQRFGDLQSLHLIDNSDLVKGETSATIPFQVVVMAVLSNAFFFCDFVRVKSSAKPPLFCAPAWFHRAAVVVAARFSSVFTTFQSWGTAFDGQTLKSCIQIRMHCYQIPYNSTTTSLSRRLLNLINNFGIITRLVCKVHGIRHLAYC